MPLDMNMHRSKVVRVEGTKVTFECLSRGHKYTKDYGKGKPSKRVGEDGVAMLTRYWNNVGGVWGPCPKCEKDRKGPKGD